MAIWAALGPFVRIVSFLGGRRDRQDDRTMTALRALSTALAETRLYLASRDRGEERNRDSEANLVRLWAGAANELRGLDAQLASICLHKSDYWIEPDEWSRHDVRAKGIQIDRLFRVYGSMLQSDDRLDRDAL